MHIDSIASLTPGQYLSLARKLAEEPGDRRPVKLALLSSNSFSFLEPYIIVECARRRIRIDPWVAPFGQIEQAILNTDEGLARVKPDIVVIAIRIEDVFPDAFLRPGHDKLLERARACIERLDRCVKSIRNTTDATVLVANFAIPHAANIVDTLATGHAETPADVVSASNRELAGRLSASAGVFIWDYAGLVRSRGTSTWTDSRLWHLARQPISAANLPHAASHLARTISGTVFSRVKCLVLDLDNTLWGGVLGDDSISGIQVGDDYPGNVFKSFQSAVLGLREKGILLAIASKNDEDLVRQAFTDHPDMVIAWDDFSVAKIGWGAKSESLKAIADELNIGIDSLAFFDDNPVEREEVRQNLPEVNVIDPPASPLGYVEALLGCGLFDSPVSSAEDANRSRYYHDEAKRKRLRASATSMDDFLASLRMKITIDFVGPETIARTTQLIEKTNQFNLTTRRHSQSAIQRMIEDSTHEVRWTRLADCYGDSGIVGISIVRFEKQVAVIDSFVMSCRVMNRKVELAMLSDIAERAVHRGCISVRGEYVATDRNGIVRGFYENSGFVEITGEQGHGLYELKLSERQACPTWPSVIGREEIRVE